MAAVQKIGQNCTFIFGKAVQTVQLHADGVVLIGTKSGDTPSVGVGIGLAGVGGDNVVLSVTGLLAGMYDAILRGLRDDPLPWRESCKRAWKQNWKSSLVPGALLGLVLGVYTFMAMLFWWAKHAPSPGTLALYLFALLVVAIVNTLYWPQLVLFQQKASIRLQNCLLFCIKYFWRVLGVGLLQLGYWTVFVLFAPWTLLLLPVLGVWYILFLSQFLIYTQMNETFSIEELYQSG